MKLNAVSCDTLAQWLSANDEIAIVDIRDQEAFGEERIPGACQFDSLAFRTLAREADRDMPMVIVCYRGRTSRNAGMWLVAEGFTRVYSLDGGMKAWREYAPERTEQGQADG